MGIVLKPCPFCGASDPKLIDSIAERRWRVDCQDCTASVSTAFKASTIALWNKRVEVPAPADPFVPPGEWLQDAEWHAVDSDGRGYFYDRMPRLAGRCWDDESGGTINDGELIDMTGLDWRNSLRHRPGGA